MRCSLFILSLSAILASSVHQVEAFNANNYYELKTSTGESGNCRGNGGKKDKVDARSKALTVAECETECDNLSTDCVAFGHNGALCILYGAGMDGSCSTNSSRKTELSCGTCSYEHKENERECGDCTVPGAACTATKCWADDEHMCNNNGGTWTAGTWTAGTWAPPPSGWEADSQHTTHVHTVSVTDGAHCYDKIRHDGEATCTGTPTSNANGTDCKTIFEGTRVRADCPGGCTFRNKTATTPPLCDGTATNVEATPDCVAAFEDNFNDASRCDAGCTYAAAPQTHPTVYFSNPESVKYPGWQSDPGNDFADIRSHEDLDPSTTGTEAQEAGVCRATGTGKAAVNYKYCKTCPVSTGASIGTQVGCKQACLDSPSGTCVGYSYSLNSWCLIYGPEEDLAANKNYTLSDGSVSDWTSITYPLKPCVTPENPSGCTTLDSSNANPSYSCFLLETSRERWRAYGTNLGSQDFLSVKLTTDSTSDGVYTSAIKTSLRQRMAALSFVIDDDVDLATAMSNGKVTVEFIITTNTTTKTPMKNLLESTLPTPGVASTLFSTQLPGSATITAVGQIGDAPSPPSPPPPPSPPSPPPASSSKTLNDPELAGVVIASIAAFAIGVFITYCCMQKRTKKRIESAPKMLLSSPHV